MSIARYLIDNVEEKVHAFKATPEIARVTQILVNIRIIFNLLKLFSNASVIDH